MNNDNWNNSEYTPMEPWEDGTYQTGSTRPPKNHGGLIALLLALVILLCGIVSIMTMLNIRIFRELNNEPDPDASAIAFHDSETTGTTAPPETSGTKQATDHSASGEKVDISLSQSPTSAPNVSQEGGMALQDIYDKNIDSVVSIVCATPGSSSSGTGVVLTEDGYLVTNAHVVEGADSIQVTFTDGQVLPATLVGADGVTDLAVLRVTGTGFTPAEFGDSSVLRVGDAVVAIGDPLGLELRGSMTNGIVSAINRNITTGGRTMTLIQTNAALNSGNSGGPLINCYGQVVGINTMKIGDYMSTAGVEGLGFAIPSTTVREIVTQLIAQGYVSGRPSLGIIGESLSSFYQLYFHLPTGLYITEVEEGSSAEEVGIQAGDILISVNDTAITDSDDLNTVLYSLKVGETVDTIIYRSGRQYAVSLTVDEISG